jgi:hypothetical protein
METRLPHTPAGGEGGEELRTRSLEYLIVTKNARTSTCRERRCGTLPHILKGRRHPCSLPPGEHPIQPRRPEEEWWYWCSMTCRGRAFRGLSPQHAQRRRLQSTAERGPEGARRPQECLAKRLYSSPKPRLSSSASRSLSSKSSSTGFQSFSSGMSDLDRVNSSDSGRELS